MGILNKIAQYKAYKKGVAHCTFNPYGPGVVRIHLVPPKFGIFKNPRYIVILNGYYLMPLGYSWAVMLEKFMDEVNKFDCKPITDADKAEIVSQTVKNTLKVYPIMDKNLILSDLNFMLSTLFAVAKGNSPEINIEKMSVRKYASNMTAPHRMDLMVSAMTDEKGNWKCNQKCLFCYAAGQTESSKKEFSTEEWKLALSKLKKAGVPMVTFTGGEPTLRKDLPELVAYSKWFVTRLNTNGVNLTSELCEKLKEASLDSAQITLYSCDEKIHNALVGSGHFSDTVEGIKNALAAGLDISVNTPLCSLNSDYVKTLEFLHILGVRFVTVSGLICTGNAMNGHDNYDLDAESLYNAVKDGVLFCFKNGMEINFTSPGLIDKGRLEKLRLNVPECGACLSNMAISPDGTVIPCQSWLNGKKNLGNILYDDWKKIWNNEICKKLRNADDNTALNCPFRTGWSD